MQPTTTPEHGIESARDAVLPAWVTLPPSPMVSGDFPILRSDEQLAAAARVPEREQLELVRMSFVDQHGSAVFRDLDIVVAAPPHRPHLVDRNS